MRECKCCNKQKNENQFKSITSNQCNDCYRIKHKAYKKKSYDPVKNKKYCDKWKSHNTDYDKKRYKNNIEYFKIQNAKNYELHKEKRKLYFRKRNRLNRRKKLIDNVYDIINFQNCKKCGKKMKSSDLSQCNCIKKTERMCRVCKNILKKSQFKKHSTVCKKCQKS